MNPKKLENNQEVFRYLVALGARLKAANQMELADAVLSASRFASGSASEFLHEAQIALTQVTQSRLVPLSAEERSEIESVLVQIKEAFRKIGGA
jgi:UV DNA damage repair endonuclease